MVLLCLIVWLPLPFGANRPMYWWPALVGFNLLTITWLIFWLRGQVTISPAFRQAKWVWWLAGYFLTFVMLQAGGWIPGLQSTEPHVTWSQLAKSWMMFQVFAMTTLLVTNHGRVKTLAWTILLAGTFQAVYGLTQESFGAVTKGTFVNRNHLAGYLEMCLSVGIGLMIANLHETSANSWREQARRISDTLLGPKVLIRICLVLMVIGLILTRSRMGNTAFFASMMIAGVIGLLLFRRSGKGVVMLFVSMIVIDIFLIGTFFGLEEVQDRLMESSTEEQRFDAAALTFEMFKDHLWTGAGLGTFFGAFTQYRNESVTLHDHAHNDYAEFAAELGILGVWPLAMIWLMSFYWSIRVQYERQSQLMKAMGFSACMAMIAIAIHSTADFNLQISANAATFMVILALPYVAYCVDRKSVPSSKRSEL